MTEAQIETRINLIKRWLKVDKFYYYSDDALAYSRGKREVDELIQDCEATGNADLTRINPDTEALFQFEMKRELVKLGCMDYER